MSYTRTPMLSVVVPTAGRPKLLRRAIESAMSAAPDGDVEVIVVPNGSDTSWRAAIACFSADARVRCEPIATAHANVARNRGLVVATGKYVRFLDDDDYLLPRAAEQIAEMERTRADICSGLLLNVDMNGCSLGTLSFPETDDFVCAAARLSGFTLPVGNVFRRDSIADCRWNEAVSRAQDYVFMIELAARREWIWVHFAVPVGVWFQHDAPRVSTVRLSSDHPAHVVQALLELWRSLRRDSRLTKSRAAAIAAALWHPVHWRFPFRPVFWHRIARQAQRISPRVRPDHPLFHHRLLRRLDPLLMEWAMLPVRRLTAAYRDFKRDQLGWDYRRRL